MFTSFRREINTFLPFIGKTPNFNMFVESVGKNIWEWNEKVEKVKTCKVIGNLYDSYMCIYLPTHSSKLFP